MKKTTKIIISLGAVIVVAAVVLAVSLLSGNVGNKDESTTLYSMQSTTLPTTTAPVVTESWVDLEQMASELATATESETVSDTTINIPSVSVMPQTSIVYVYVSEVPVTATTTKSSSTITLNDSPEMSEYKYSVNSETRTATISKYLGDDSVVMIPETISGYTVTGIADKCFENETLKAVCISENVTSIGVSAFANCKNLETVTFMGVPYTVTVGDGAFKNCPKLKNINLPVASSIGNSAFAGCTSLETLVIKDGTEAIGSYCFEGCTKLKSITIPESVSTIGSGIFNGIENKENLVVKCVAGSQAETAANKYAVKVEYITE